jgi:hypothetical protein
MKELAKKICEAVDSGTLIEPFNAAMIRAACPGWSDRTYHVFLTEHAAGVGNPNELFERVSFGLYCLYRPCSEIDSTDANNAHVVMTGD